MMEAYVEVEEEVVQENQLGEMQEEERAEARVNLSIQRKNQEK